MQYQITKNDVYAIEEASTVLRDAIKAGLANEREEADYRNALKGLMAIIPIPIPRDAFLDPKGAA